MDRGGKDAGGSVVVGVTSALAIAGLAVSSLIAGSGAAKAAGFSCAASDQWYTGSLLSPGGAMPKAGMALMEPYLIGGIPVRSFDSNGRG